MSQAGIINAITGTPTVATSYTTDDLNSAVPVLNNLNIEGAGGIVTSSSGSTVTITYTGSTGLMTWTEVTTTSQAMAADSGYIANNVGLVTLTLPAVAAVGDVYEIIGKGAGGWRLAQNAGQTVHFGVKTTTTGAAGHIQSTHTLDAIMLVCITANTNFAVRSVIGNLTIG